ncbi:MAG: peptidase M22 [Oscillospiraceae bacterium]|nr:peptidase M22 [Oscillospiraceae bacterium]
MSEFLGIDTSNYTTSAAIYDDEKNKAVQEKMLLPVKSGECGLRQSDAVFHHTKQISSVLESLLKNSETFKAIGVSDRPRNIDGSYMPCFLVGKNAAEIISYTAKTDVFYTSHQIGHIAAALFSCGKLPLMNERFLAFHVSGGTTDCLLCTPDENEIINAQLFSSSLDLKAGQAIDRIGVMMGMNFPCGKQLEKLASYSNENFKINVKLKNNDCCLSGLENQCRKMFESGVPQADIAKYCLTFIGKTIKKMTAAAFAELGEMPVVYAGGVMSDMYIKEMLENNETYFAQPEFSCDNAVGTAVIASEKYKRKYRKC